jgi:tetratricopeptide (TPR) repeat protein
MKIKISDIMLTLSKIYYINNDYKFVHDIYERVLTVRKALLEGIYHYPTGEIYKEIGNLYLIEEKLIESKQHFLISLDIFENILGISSLFLANILESLGDIEVLNEVYVEANDYYERELVIFNSTYGVINMNNIEILKKIINVNVLLNDSNSITNHLNIVLSIYKQFHGEDSELYITYNHEIEEKLKDIHTKNKKMKSIIGRFSKRFSISDVPISNSKLYYYYVIIYN